MCHHPGVDIEDITLLLRRRRGELAADLERLTAPPPPGSTVAFGKRVGDGTSEAVERMSTTAAARSIARSLADVDRALVKIETGTYGLCDQCGATIPFPRLTALPATAHCVDCLTAT